MIFTMHAGEYSPVFPGGYSGFGETGEYTPPPTLSYGFNLWQSFNNWG